MDAYNLDLLAADVVGLIDAAGAEKAYLVGHDWGGAVAWWVAMRYPQRLHKLGVLNSPHPYAMARALRGWAQRLKSWYMLLFQIPWLPEQLIRFNNWQAGVQSLVKSSRRGTFDEADLAAYRQAWAQPGAMTAMLNWYRAMAQHPPQGSRKTRVTVPTLVLWGVRDTFLGPELAEMSVEMCDNGRFHLIRRPIRQHRLRGNAAIKRQLALEILHQPVMIQHLRLYRIQRRQSNFHQFGQNLLNLAVRVHQNWQTPFLERFKQACQSRLDIFAPHTRRKE